MGCLSCPLAMLGRYPKAIGAKRAFELGKHKETPTGGVSGGWCRSHNFARRKSLTYCRGSNRKSKLLSIYWRRACHPALCAPFGLRNIRFDATTIAPAAMRVAMPGMSGMPVESPIGAPTASRGLSHVVT